MQSCWQDLRFGLRQMGRSPGCYGLIIAILALGIGANCAIFSKLNQALFRYHARVQNGCWELPH